MVFDVVGIRTYYVYLIYSGLAVVARGGLVGARGILVVVAGILHAVFRELSLAHLRSGDNTVLNALPFGGVHI